MSHQLRSVPLLLLLFPALCATTFAQEDDGGLLYFPPTLTVGAYVDKNYSWWYTIAGYNGDEIFQMPAMEKELVFTIEKESESITLLPIIFFDQGSYVIPERYQQFTGAGQAFNYVDSADIQYVASNYLPYELLKYYQILNVVGYRLAQSPSTTIALEGGCSTGPGEDEALATERVRSVRDYLLNIWKIEPERIAILPSRPACDSAANIFKQEEAQRVAIYTNNHDLFRPVNYRVVSIENYHVLFTVSIDPRMAPEDVAGIELVITSDDDILSHTSIPASRDSASYSLTGLWLIPRDIERMGAALSVQAFVRSTDGRVRTSEVVGIPIIINGPEPELPDLPPPGESLLVDVSPKDSAGKPSGSPRYIDIYSLQSEYSIPFFEASDTAFSQLQLGWIRECLDSISQRMAMYPEGRWQITVTGSGEGGEMPGVQNADLATNLAAYRSLNSYFSSLDNDRTLQLAIYFFPALNMTQDPEFDAEGLATSIRSTWYGDRAGEFEEALQGWETIPFHSEHPDNSGDRIDSLLLRRAEGGVQHIFPNLDKERIDTAYAFYAYGSYGDNGVGLAYTPEERFYQRSVTIMLEISDTLEDLLWTKYREEQAD